jgi:hypothetical protein
VSTHVSPVRQIPGPPRAAIASTIVHVMPASRWLELIANHVGLEVIRLPMGPRRARNALKASTSRSKPLRTKRSASYVQKTRTRLQEARTYGPVFAHQATPGSQEQMRRKGVPRVIKELTRLSMALRLVVSVTAELMQKKQRWWRATCVRRTQTLRVVVIYSQIVSVTLVTQERRAVAAFVLQAPSSRQTDRRHAQSAGQTPFRVPVVQHHRQVACRVPLVHSHPKEVMKIPTAFAAQVSLLQGRAAGSATSARISRLSAVHLAHSASPGSILKTLVRLWDARIALHILFPWKEVGLV